jgi:hypothetical protein
MHNICPKYEEERERRRCRREMKRPKGSALKGSACCRHCRGQKEEALLVICLSVRLVCQREREREEPMRERESPMSSNKREMESVRVE